MPTTSPEQSPMISEEADVLDGNQTPASCNNHQSVEAGGGDGPRTQRTDTDSDHRKKSNHSGVIDVLHRPLLLAPCPPIGSTSVSSQLSKNSSSLRLV